MTFLPLTNSPLLYLKANEKGIRFDKGILQQLSSRQSTIPKWYLNHKEKHISILIIVKNIVNQDKEGMTLTLTHNLLTLKEVSQSLIVQIVKIPFMTFRQNQYNSMNLIEIPR